MRQISFLRNGIIFPIRNSIDRSKWIELIKIKKTARDPYDEEVLEIAMSAEALKGK